MIQMNKWLVSCHFSLSNNNQIYIKLQENSTFNKFDMRTVFWDLKLNKMRLIKIGFIKMCEIHKRYLV